MAFLDARNILVTEKRSRDLHLHTHVEALIKSIGMVVSTLQNHLASAPRFDKSQAVEDVAREYAVQLGQLSLSSTPAGGALISRLRGRFLQGYIDPIPRPAGSQIQQLTKVMPYFSEDKIQETVELQASWRHEAPAAFHPQADSLSTLR